MAKKPGSVWEGIRDAYDLHEALETLGAFRKSGGQFLTYLGEVALMVAVLAAVIGLVYFVG